jgi:hypothetical protein
MPREPSTAAPEHSLSRTDRGEDRLRERRPADDRSAEERLQTHLLTLLSVSSGMVGVCLTAIGLVGIIKSLDRIELVVDDLLALSALLFLVASALSFVGMRTRLAHTWRPFERTLDAVFCLGLALVVVATLLLTWRVL